MKFIQLSAALLLLQLPSAAQSPGPIDRGYMYIESGGAAGESKDVQIARALAAGPRTIIGGARIVGVDSQGKAIRPRQGRNGFPCQPGNPNVTNRPSSCANEAALQWSADLFAGKPAPSNSAAGFVYM